MNDDCKRLLILRVSKKIENEKMLTKKRMIDFGPGCMVLGRVRDDLNFEDFSGNKMYNNTEKYEHY